MTEPQMGPAEIDYVRDVCVYLRKGAREDFDVSLTFSLDRPINALAVIGRYGGESYKVMADAKAMAAQPADWSYWIVTAMKDWFRL